MLKYQYKNNVGNDDIFNMKLEQTLLEYGLKDKQIKVYLACLQLGTASVVKIAEKSNMPRSTVYEILESLYSLGIVTSFLKKKIKYFGAEEPDHLVKYAETKVSLLRDVLPELNALAGKSRKRPSTRFYQGKDGMKIIFEEMLGEADELCVFGNADDYFDEMGEYHKNFLKRRVQNKIPIRNLLRDSDFARERQKLGLKQLRTVKLLPATYDYHGLIYIWKNKIAMFSFTNDFVVVVIESRELADMEKAMFEYLWDKTS